MDLWKTLISVRQRHPDLFADNPDDPRTRTRTVPMRVLCLGLSRTGTLSMKVALEQLGIPTYHGFNLQTNPADCHVWNEALDAKFKNPLDSFSLLPSFLRGYAQKAPPPPFERADWDRLLGNVSAVADMPAWAFGPELIDAYPEAKVVLVHRDIDDWFESYDNAIIRNRFHPIYSLPSFIDPVLGRPIRGVMDRMHVGYFGVKTMTRDEVRRAVREGYEGHYELIRRVTPKERLLEYELGSGWDPLCDFLDLEKPVGVDFPKVNELKALKELIVALTVASFWKFLKAYRWMIGASLCAVIAMWVLLI